MSSRPVAEVCGGNLELRRGCTVVSRFALSCEALGLGEGVLTGLEASVGLWRVTEDCLEPETLPCGRPVTASGPMPSSKPPTQISVSREPSIDRWLMLAEPMMMYVSSKMANLECT